MPPAALHAQVCVSGCACQGVWVNSRAMSSLYRGVSKPAYKGCYRGWLAQCKPKKLWKIGFETPEAARDWLAVQLGVPPASLCKSPRPQTRPLGSEPKRGSGSQGVLPARQAVTSQFFGVFGRPTRRRGMRWQARANGKYCGTYSSEAAAARAVAGALKRKLRKLKKGTVRTRKRTRDTFIAAHKAFKDYCPGDVLVTWEQEGNALMLKDSCWFDLSSLVNISFPPWLRFALHPYFLC